MHMYIRVTVHRTCHSAHVEVRGHLFPGSLCFHVFKGRVSLVLLQVGSGDWLDKGEGVACLDLPCVAFCDISWGDIN